MDDPVLSDLHYTDDSNGTTVYYTILEEGSENIDGNNILTTDSHTLLGDNVFYLSFENEQSQQESIDNQNEENEGETNCNGSVFEQITLPDGTHAYLKNEPSNAVINYYPVDEEDSSLIQEPTLTLEDLVDLNDDPPNENSGDEDEPGEAQEIKTEIQQFEDFITTDENTIEQSEYEQVRLADGSLAIIESVLYKSLVAQNQKKSQPPKDVNKAYDCPHENCNKAYTTMHHLRVHMRNHTGNRPYRCDVPGCEKAFSTGYSLKAHSRTHTGEKPYGCSLCFKSFKTSGDLQKHIRIHTGEKPFVCPIEGCGRSFTTSNIRKVHVRSHTGERPYECTVEGCDRAFASATNFKNHMRIHSGEKPYACTVEGCGKRFTEYSSLYKHHLVHTNFKPCKCDYCRRTFRQPSTLVAHKRSVHNIFITENGTEIMLNLSNTNEFVLAETEEQDNPETQIVFVSQ